MSAQNGDTVTQEEALDEEEELALGVEKLKIVRPFQASPYVWGRGGFCTPTVPFTAIGPSRGLGNNARTATRCDGDGCVVPD
jgi:hypothetical protein